MKKEEKHLHIRAGSKELPSKDNTDTEPTIGLILTIPYVAGLSETIQRVCRDFNIKTHLSRVRHIRSLFTKV